MTEIPHPLFISSRLMAAYKIDGVGTLHLLADHRDRERRIVYRYVIEAGSWRPAPTCPPGSGTPPTACASGRQRPLRVDGAGASDPSRERGLIPGRRYPRKGIAMRTTACTLRFVEQDDRYSTYTRPDGEEVYIAHGFPRVYLVDFDKDWMRDEWRKVHPIRASYYYHTKANRERFLTWLRDHLIDPDLADDVQFCESCGDPVHDDDGSETQGSGFACQPCIEENYYSCNSCDDLTKETTHTADDCDLCEHCLESSYTYCQECDDYYHDTSDHTHNDAKPGCECTSPVLTFGIRNDGNGMLFPDDQVTVGLPAGVLDDEGRAEIGYYLREERMYEAARLVDTLDARWQTKEGNFTKRLSRALYQKHGLKISAEVLSKVGNIARDHSKPVDFLVATTRDFNQSAADFGHEDSCYWQSYSSSRCTLKSHGAFGLRSFDEYGDVSGRAWVMPLMVKRASFEPTFNTESPDAFVVFNGYGDLGGYTATRIISHMVGMTYRKVGFTASPMFINGDTAYLVAPEELASRFTDGEIRMSLDPHYNLHQTELDAAKELVNV